MSSVRNRVGSSVRRLGLHKLVIESGQSSRLSLILFFLKPDCPYSLTNAFGMAGWNMVKPLKSTHPSGKVNSENITRDAEVNESLATMAWHTL